MGATVVGDGAVHVQLGIENIGKTSGAILTIEYGGSPTMDWPPPKLKTITLVRPETVKGECETRLYRELDATADDGSIYPHFIGRLVYNSAFGDDLLLRFQC